MELSRASGKLVEKILLAICKQASEQRQEALEALEQGVPQLERCLVHDGTPLVHEYHSKVLGRLAKLLNLYGQAQFPTFLHGLGVTGFVSTDVQVFLSRRFRN